MALNTPPKRDSERPAKTIPPENDQPLTVKAVGHLNITALLANILSAAIIFGIFRKIVYLKTSELLWVIGIPLSVIGVIVVFLWKKLWTSVDTQKGQVWLNQLWSDTIIVYKQGFHFVPWWYGKNDSEEDLDFQKHRPVGAHCKDNNAVKCTTTDAQEMFFEFTAFYQNDDSAEALGYRLKYKQAELDATIYSKIKSSLSELGGLNTYNNINGNKFHVSAWLADLFGGEDVTSEFEKRMGIKIKNPYLDDLGLTADSLEVLKLRNKRNLVVETKKQLMDDDENLSSDEASLAAQAIADVAKRSIETINYKIEGLGKEVTTVALGSGAGIAVGNNKPRK